MSQLDDMQRTLNRVVELLEKLTGQQVQPTGMTRTADGAMFLPGTGPLGGQRHHHEPDPPLPDETERRRILDQARADRAAARHPEHD